MYLLIFLILSVVAAVAGIAIYNRLVASGNAYRNAFAQIAVQLRRRHDLIPNLVETAKAYLGHEHDTLLHVAAARSRAESGLAAALPENAEALATLAHAEGALTQAMRGLMVQIEAYPELQAAANMRALFEEIASTENRVAFARQAYNDAVMQYNTLRQMFPHNVIARYFGHHRDAQLLEFVDAAKYEEVPGVRF